MRNIIDYKVVSTKGTAELEAEIKNQLQNGWQPLGGVSSTTAVSNKTGTGVILFTQALVKYGS